MTSLVLELADYERFFSKRVILNKNNLSLQSFFETCSQREWGRDPRQTIKTKWQ